LQNLNSATDVFATKPSGSTDNNAFRAAENVDWEATINVESVTEENVRAVQNAIRESHIPAFKVPSIRA
jgi:hypothetical protein